MAKGGVVPFDIDHLLGKPKNRIRKLGVELEGGWNTLPPGTKLEHDGSVFRDTVCPPGLKKGELPLGPMQPGALSKFMKKYYPSYVDGTCGMHVHMSFTHSRQLAWLADGPEYQETVVAYLTRWAKAEGFDPDHHIWERLAGNSDFCQKKFWPHLQLSCMEKDHDRQRPGHRYTIVHYCGRQSTIEVRVLPMMVTVAQAISAVNYLVAITNASLMVCPKRERKHVVRVDLSEDEDYSDNEVELPLTAGQRRMLRESR